MDEFKQKEVQEIYLMVRASNAPAQKLYEKFGFEKIGVRKNYYYSPDEEALIYRLNFLLHR